MSPRGPPSAPKCGIDGTTIAPKLLDLALALSHLAFVPTSAAPIHGPPASIFFCVVSLGLQTRNR